MRWWSWLVGACVAVVVATTPGCNDCGGPSGLSHNPDLPSTCDDSEATPGDGDGLGAGPSVGTGGSTSPGGASGTGDAMEEFGGNRDLDAPILLRSSTHVEVRRVTSIDRMGGQGGEQIQDESICRRYALGDLTADQLAQLEAIRLVELDTSCTFDGHSYLEIIVFDEDGSWAKYRDTGCPLFVVPGATAMLPRDELSGLFDSQTGWLRVPFLGIVLVPWRSRAARRGETLWLNAA